MTDKWMTELTVEKVSDPPSEREFRALYLGEFPLRYQPQDEAERRLKRRGRDVVLRDLCHEIDEEPDPTRREHLRRVRDAVAEK